MQYFSNLRYNTAVSDVFSRVLMETKNTGKWYAELTWYSLNATHWIFQGREGEYHYSTVRCRARLIFSECYSLDLLTSRRGRTPQNSQARGERYFKPGSKSAKLYDDIPQDQVYDSTSTWELTHMYQVFFVYILRYRMPECSMKYIEMEKKKPQDLQKMILYSPTLNCLVSYTFIRAYMFFLFFFFFAVCVSRELKCRSFAMFSIILSINTFFQIIWKLSALSLIRWCEGAHSHATNTICSAIFKKTF